jgi:hypothetical protein
VQVPCGMQWVVNADVARKRGKAYPATHHGRVRLTRHKWWRGVYRPSLSSRGVYSSALLLLHRPLSLIAWCVQ